jgi:hypothetical protein
MKKKIAVILVALNLVSFAQKEVKLKVSQYMPYCGGARPPKDVEQAARTAQPYANMTLIYKNAKGKVDSVKTDDTGMATLNLNYGTYTFYEAWRHYKKLPDPSLKNNYDKKCMEKEWNKPLIVIIASEKIDEKLRTIEIYQLCPHQQPCAIKKYFPE